MATFDYTGALPQFKAPITSGQLRNRYNDLKTHINTNNPSGIVFPDTSGGAQNQAFILDATLIAPTLSHVVRADASINLTGVGSLANGDMFYFNGSDIA